MLPNYDGERRMTVKDMVDVADPDIKIRVENVFGKVLLEIGSAQNIDTDNRLLSTLVEGVTADVDTLVIITSDKCPKGTVIR